MLTWEALSVEPITKFSVKYKVEELHLAVEEGLEVEAVEEGGRYQGSLELTKLSPGETYTAM